MTFNLNRVQFAGRITREPELRTVGTVNKVHFRMEIVRQRKKAGKPIKDVVSLTVEAWDRIAENIARYFDKGRTIYVEGRLTLAEWEKDGRKQSRLYVVAERFEFVDAPPSAKGRAASTSTPQTKSQSRQSDPWAGVDADPSNPMA